VTENNFTLVVSLEKERRNGTQGGSITLIVSLEQERRDAAVDA
jgi:hypothetical protein